jgi:hypothetical protein
MKEFIKEVLVQMHKETTTDKYGQVSRSEFTPHLFGDRKEEVEQFCKENKGILNYATYGAIYGTYKAFTIEDPEIREACYEALGENENYIRNVNSWY